MSNTIHPAAKIVAAKFGAEIISIPGGGFRLLEIATGNLSEDTYDKVGECNQELKAGTVVYEKPRQPQGNRSGVMTRSYHDQYSKNPNGPGCGDTVDVSLREAITLTDDKGKFYASAQLIKQIGVECGLWRSEWEVRNVGMQRMNLANRIRGYLRQDESREVTIGSQSGRFGIEARQPKVRAEKVKAAKAA